MNIGKDAGGMVTVIVNFIDVLIGKGILDDYHTEEYVYALTLLVERTLTYSILLLVAVATDNLLPGCIYISCFILLRKGTGGFHARHYINCLIGTNIIFLAALEIFAPLTERSMGTAIVLLLLSGITILFFSPVNHPNLILDQNEMQEHRLWIRMILGIEMFFYMFGLLTQAWWKQYILTAIITCAVLILIAKLLRQEVKTDEM